MTVSWTCCVEGFLIGDLASGTSSEGFGVTFPEEVVSLSSVRSDRLAMPESMFATIELTVLLTNRCEL